MAAKDKLKPKSVDEAPPSAPAPQADQDDAPTEHGEEQAASALSPPVPDADPAPEPEAASEPAPEPVGEAEPTPEPPPAPEPIRHTHEGVPYLRAWCHLDDSGKSFRCDRVLAVLPDPLR